MSKYLSIYKEFFSSALAEAISFRVNFVLVIVMDLLCGVTNYLTVGLMIGAAASAQPLRKTNER